MRKRGSCRDEWLAPQRSVCVRRWAESDVRVIVYMCRAAGRSNSGPSENVQNREEAIDAIASASARLFEQF